MLLPKSFKEKFSRYKITRRMVGLFLLASLIPVITSTILSTNYVSKLLIENELKQMKEEIRLYGFSINERLLFIEKKIKNAALSFSFEKENKKNHNEKEFSLVALVDENGKISYFNKKMHEPFVLPTLIKDNNKNHVFIEPSSHNLYMAVDVTTSTENKKTLVAQIKFNYLWGDKDSFSSGNNVCVLAGAHQILFCSNLEHVAVWENKKTVWQGNKVIKWDLYDESYVTINWLLFLKSKFTSSNWNIVSSKQESHILKPIKSFNNTFYLIILLTLLIVSYVSLSQVRKSLRPLELLIEGTRRVSNNDFSVPVEVQSKDEFEELAVSFNLMSERIGLQLNTLSLLSEIDSLILVEPTDEHIITVIISGIKECVPSATISVVVFDEKINQWGRTYYSEFNYPEDNVFEKTYFKKEDLECYSSTKNKGYVNIQKDLHSYTHPFERYKLNSSYVFPINTKNDVVGFIFIGYNDDLKINAVSLKQIFDLTHRLSIAIATAEKDKSIFQQANFDSLTNLPNRQLFNDRLEREVFICKRLNMNFTLFFIDLDRFKNINDTLGHIIGDAVLQQIAMKLDSCVRESDTVARIGGDEFVVILVNVGEEHEISGFAEKIIQTIAEPFYIEGNELFVNASIGISIYPFDGSNNIELLKSADIAMYSAKSLGRAQYMYFEKKMNSENTERAELEIEIRQALENNEFELYYQPIMDVENLSVVGAESLLRWNNPKKGIVSPAVFIPLAESMGLIESIGEWVLTTACNQCQQWREQGLCLDFIAVNVSSRQFEQDDFVYIVSKALFNSGLSAKYLELEITENLLVNQKIDDSDIFSKLKEMGVSLSIDDFGTGYSSFSYLKRFPVSKLKIDLSFMVDVPGDEDANSIVNSIIVLAHTLNLKVVTEGIETKEQLDFLQLKKSDLGQGYYFAKPMKVNAFLEYFNKLNR